MTEHAITIEIDDSKLGSYTDQRLALIWHVAQANPVGIGDKAAGQLVERIGREIIRRWVKEVPPELHHHQGWSYYQQQLCRFAKYVPGGDPKVVGDPEWDRGEWVAREPEERKP